MRRKRYRARMERGQAMVETLIACVAVVFVTMLAIRFSRMLLAKTSAEYAAQRVARAKAVGLNGFMCAKTANLALVPASGKKLHPLYSPLDEGRMRAYMASANWPEAQALLRYELWPAAHVRARVRSGLSPEAVADVRLADPEFAVRGNAKVEAHFPLYMDDAGR